MGEPDILTSPTVIERYDREVERWEFVEALRRLADYLETTPSAPVHPGPRIVQHIADRGEARSAAKALGVAADIHGEYAEFIRRIGPIRYGIQTPTHNVQRPEIVKGPDGRDVVRYVPDALAGAA